MKRIRLVAVLIAAVLAASVQSEAFSKTRNCTAAEKERANARLVEIAGNNTLRKRLLNRHLIFGAHEASGSTANERVLVQGGYVMNHDSDLRTALWVSYRLTAKDMTDAKGKDRVNCFRRDPRLGAALTGIPSDYDEPRFDQGHMANDADMKDNLIEQLNTYVLSNMSPQECRFNRGIWLSLEELGRAWATAFSTIYITSGAIFDRNNDSIRDKDEDAVRMKSRNDKARVAVPSHYYKVFLRKEGDSFKSIAFLIEHTNDPHGVVWADVRPRAESAITSIAEIEKKAGLRLHPNLDRSRLAQSASGEGWDLSLGEANLENSCN